MLREVFTKMVHRYTNDYQKAIQLWTEINRKYSSRKRYYHNLTHIDALYNQLVAYKQQVQDWDTLLFSLFYHDIIYNVLRKDNEERSAALAGKRLQSMGFPPSQIEKCRSQIIATSGHGPSEDHDTNLFTDADLSILGQERERYKVYCMQIRKEYRLYPDIVYKPGRRKVISQFLGMARIFKTKEFFDRYEVLARENLQWELAQLCPDSNG